MHKTLSLLLAIIVWFAVTAQFWLIIENRATDIPETVIRFFSFFTILTNILAAMYFSGQYSGKQFTNQPGVLTAVTCYIFIVGIVYQIVLRQLWHPTGLQKLADELLHSVNPLLVILYWYNYEKKDGLHYRAIKNWLIYPVVYLLYILIRGNFSGFYPYPFADVKNIGIQKALLNSSIILLFFIGIACLLIALGKRMAKKVSLNKVL